MKHPTSLALRTNGAATPDFQIGFRFSHRSSFASIFSRQFAQFASVLPFEIRVHLCPSVVETELFRLSAV